MKNVHYFTFGGLLISMGIIGLYVIIDWPSIMRVNPPSKIQTQSTTSTALLQQLLGNNHSTNFQQAIHPINFQFPSDHGAHPAFRSEWWYLTGHLFDNHQQHYGFQFTLFRFAAHTKTTPINPWLTPQFYMAHVALSNSQQQIYRSAAKLSRQGPGLANVQLNPFHGWLENWQLKSSTSDTLFPATIKAYVLQQPSTQQITPQQTLGLQLTIHAVKPLVLQGKQGLSQKSPTLGNASYYYSYPRLAVQGSINWNQQQIPVIGQAWFDHEWGTSALDNYQLGWDWFSLQLNNQQELMIYQIRSQPGHPETLFGMLYQANQQLDRLNADQIEIKIIKHWKAPDGKKWPGQWQINIRDYNLSLTLTPTQPNQLIKHLVTYWEGAVKINGSHQGWGFVELTGY